jgi:hypothetical protein
MQRLASETAGAWGSQAERMARIVIDRLNLILDNASAGNYTSYEAFA